MFVASFIHRCIVRFAAEDEYSVLGRAAKLQCRDNQSKEEIKKHEVDQALNDVGN